MSAWGKLHAATLELAKGTPLKQRLVAAFSMHLTELAPADLPPPLRAQFTELLQAFEAVAPMRGETAVQATVRKLSAEAADQIAARIVTLFGQVARASTPRGVDDPARSLNESFDFDRPENGADVLPLFAIKG